MKKHKYLILLIIALFFLNSCMPGSGEYNPAEPAGFFSGVWHGWIAPISLIVALFQDNITIYEVYNTGWWYDFGFYIAVISGFGGIALTRRGSGN